MRRKAVMLLTAVAAVAAVPAGAAASPAPANQQPDILVTGENRIVCRYVMRTGTRMRVGRLCRRLSDWRIDADAAIRAGFDANATIDGAADTLEVLGEMHGPRPGGPLGPR